MNLFPTFPALFLRAPEDGAAAGAAMMAGCMGVYLLFILAITVFFIFCFWKIFTKAGYSGALALLFLIPGVGGLIAICILAFGSWPALSNRQ